MRYSFPKSAPISASQAPVRHSVNTARHVHGLMCRVICLFIPPGQTRCCSYTSFSFPRIPHHFRSALSGRLKTVGAWIVIMDVLSPPVFLRGEEFHGHTMCRSWIFVVNVNLCVRVLRHSVSTTSPASIKKNNAAHMYYVRKLYQIHLYHLPLLPDILT